MRGRVARSAFALTSAGLVVLGLAGCSQSAPEQDSGDSDLSIVEQVQIDESDLRIEIRPESIGFYESLGELTAIDIASPDDITVTLAMEGEGETWDMQRRFVLSDDGATLTPQAVGEENFEPMPLKKCE